MNHCAAIEQYCCQHHTVVQLLTDRITFYSRSQRVIDNYEKMLSISGTESYPFNLFLTASYHFLQLQPSGLPDLAEGPA